MTEIDFIQFSVLSSETIKKISVAEIVTHDVFDKQIPKHGGLSDLRLGTIDRQFRCQTCKQDAIGCPGHFGHISLANPVYHICFIKHIVKVLQIICVNCQNCKIKIPTRCYKSSKQFKYMYDICKMKNKCVHCNFVQPKIIIDKYDIYFEYENKIKQSAKQVLSILSKISDQTCSNIGINPEFSHPKFCILENILVPPPHVRPSISMDASLRSQDDLTHKLCEIIKTNNMLLKHINSNSPIEQIQPISDLLQYHIITYIDNGIPGINHATQRTGRPLKAICQRLKSKDGRVRGNLMGKRVNFSARTVITAEPDIDLDELGVPHNIATVLTFPERVTNYNKNILQNYVNNGPSPPLGVTGANIVHQGDLQKDLRFVNNIELNIGDVVDRHLKDGDYVIFNRQPSLHKMSMMGHKIKVMPHSTFRMNVCATTPYNADYDGDEMNVHAPQNLQSIAEIKEIMSVSHNIVSPQSNKPVIGIIQDTLLGCHKISLKDTFLPKELVNNIFIRINKKCPMPAILKPTPLWTGKQIISSLLPHNFKFQRKSNMFGEHSTQYNDDSYVNIFNGYICSGNLDKRSLGASELGIIHLLWIEYSHEIAKNFVSQLQYAINYWLTQNGFSIGAPDIFINSHASKEVRQHIISAKDEVNQLINICNINNDIKISDYENKINQILNNAMSQAGLIVKNNINLSNNINSTVTGGSKGSMFNISQIMGCVGQQNVNGRRIDIGYTHRVLPHFAQHDISPDAKGFVENSYKNGLQPHEFFFHAMGGREGIIDTAVKSISYDSEIIISINGITQYTHIGSLINSYMDKYPDNIIYTNEHHANMEILSIINDEIFIPTSSNNGITSWGKITKMTRHDPSKFIYEFKTKFGRHVKVVESKTMLVWNGNEFIPTESKNVSIGDNVPVTFNINNYYTNDHILLERFLPKHIYIHGSEYHNALTNKPNILPHKHINITRFSKYAETIQKGFIYPYGARRTNSKIPEVFSLNKSNGFFIGLYIAEGNSCLKSGKVCISNTDPTILSFLESYFNSLNISHKTYTKPSNVHTSTTFQAYSTLFAKFLIEFVGHGSNNKQIPDTLFNAPREFVIALLDGYFSGDGHVSKNSVECSSASKQLIVGISMLLSQLGIMSKMWTSKISNYLDSHRLSVRSHMAQLFCKIIPLSHPNKFSKQQIIINSKSITKLQNYYSFVNDVFMDEIVSITISEAPDEKVYDFTVPSTLNFTLANGLTVYDTSETGYIQRRLIKAMEDLQVCYDHSVRNSSGDIISFVYGDDGLDASLLMTDTLYINNFNSLINNNTPQEEYNKLHEIFNIHKHNKFTIRVPFIIDRLIDNLPHISAKDIPCNQQVIFEHVVALTKKCTINNNHSVISKYSTFAIHHLLFTKLNSAFLVQKLDEQNIIQLCNNIFSYYIRSVCQKGESIGTLAAQSIGENVTQLTLNTFHSAGYSAKNVTLGVPRFRELINVAKTIKSPSMSLHIKNSNQMNIDFLAASLEYVQLFDIVTTYEIFDIDLDSYSDYFDFPEFSSPIVEFHNQGIILYINSFVINNKHISLIDICISLLQKYECQLVPIIHNDSIHLIFAYNETIDYSALKQFICKIKSHIINGIDGISKVYIDNNILETDGTSFSNILQHPHFDFTKCITNDIIEVHETLGIEAARLILYQEIKKVLEFDGTYINPRHFITLVDTMTSKGNLMSITRHGINRSDNGPLMKCSFEETVDVLTDAALFSESDKLRGVTENITVGKLANIGTGSFELFYSSNFSKNIPPSSNNISSDNDDIISNFSHSSFDSELSNDFDNDDDIEDDDIQEDDVQEDDVQDDNFESFEDSFVC